MVNFLYVITKLFSLSLTAETYIISGNLSKSACFERGGSLCSQISDGRG